MAKESKLDKSRKEFANKMIFSVIIPSYNEAGQIKRCIESVKANKDIRIPFEILVVDNESTDETVEIVKRLGVKVIENTAGTISTLRNVGAAATSGQILAFLDADMIVSKVWLQKAWEYFNQGFQGALGFVDSVPNTAGWIGKTWGNRLRLNRPNIIEVDFLPSRNICINRHVFEKINGFNERLITGEDKNLTFKVLQAGFKVISVPDILIIHLGYERSLLEFIKKEFWRQGDTLQFAKQMGFSFRSLRNPLLSFWHILFISIFIIAITCLNFYFIFAVLVGWILPSMLITYTSLGIKQSPKQIVPFFLLTFLRWNVSGLALIYQLSKGNLSHN